MTAKEFELGGGLEAAGRARRALESLTDEVDPALHEDLRLLITELVTNSVRHAGVHAGDTLVLTVSISRETLRAEVHDGGETFEPVAEVPKHPAAQGWGLVMVDRIADRWGVEGDGGKYVWFEIDRATR
ncbi:MAG TPA: ATP-binding protein [Thermoleophilaceae bacterium]|nr:ATP-binding protein [Thermoleophilaceae bacterium]